MDSDWLSQELRQVEKFLMGMTLMEKVRIIITYFCKALY